MKETLIRLSFLFVLSTVHEDVWKVLKRYSSMLVVEVIPWALPGHLPNDPETRSQFLHAETWQRRRLEVRYHSRFLCKLGSNKSIGIIGFLNGPSFIPETHGPLGNCIPVGVNQVILCFLLSFDKFLMRAHFSNKILKKNSSNHSKFFVEPFVYFTFLLLNVTVSLSLKDLFLQ